MDPWKIWVHGLGSAFIGGGASGVVAAQAAMGIAPNTFNYSSGLGKMLRLGGVVFLISGALSAFGYLKTSPLPSEDEKGDTK